MEQTKNLTIKQRMFVKEYAASGNATQAALSAYNCSNPKSADAVARETLENPRVNSAIHELMKENGLDNESLLLKHQELLSDPDPAIRLRALDMAYKLSGSYKHVQLILSRSEHVEVKPPPLDIRPRLDLEELKRRAVEALKAEMEGTEWKKQARANNGLDRTQS